MTWTRRFPLLTVLLCAVLALGACTAGGSDQTKTGGVLRIGTSNGIDSMNPFVGTNQDGFSVWMQMYPSLLQYDTTKDDFPYKGSLAESWEMSADGLTVTFKLRTGAKWSDGEPLDASDVEWSLGVMHKYNESAAAGWSIGSSYKTIKATDDRTIVITLDKPYALVYYDLGTTPILPPQVWEKYATGDGAALKTFANEPSEGKPVVSGGPFMLTKYTKGDVAVFTKNPNWYGEKPKIDGFGLQTYKNADAMITALTTGNLDAATGIAPTSLKALENANLTIDKGPALAMRDLIINTNPKKAKHRELLDPNIRKALEHAINRESIVQTAWVGEATPGTTIIAPVSASNGQKWHNDSIKAIPYDLNEANRLLDAAGLKRGGDGVRIANGQPMVYEVLFADDESGPGDRAFQIIKSDFEKVGIKLSQRKLDASAMWNAIYCGEDCQCRDFDLAMWDWFPGQDPAFMMSAMTCAQWGDWNDAGYCSKRFDELNEQQRHTIDPAARKKILDEMQQIVYEDRPYVILTYDVRIDAWSPKWTAFAESPQGFFNNWSTQTLESVHQV